MTYKDFKVRIEWEDVENLIRNALRDDYVDQITVWKHQPDSQHLAAALFEVIKYYSAPNEFEEWVETVKENIS